MLFPSSKEALVCLTVLLRRYPPLGVELALTFLSRQGVVLARLNSVPYVAMSSCGLMALFFPFSKRSSGVLANSSLCGAETTVT